MNFTMPEKPQESFKYDADGKDRRMTKEEEMDKIKELSSLLGLNKTNYYGTFDKQEFASRLETMSLGAKRQLARNLEIFLLPLDSEKKLDKELLNNFDPYIRSLGCTMSGPIQESVRKDTEAYKSIEDLL